MKTYTIDKKDGTPPFELCFVEPLIWELIDTATGDRVLTGRMKDDSLEEVKKMLLAVAEHTWIKPQFQ